MPKVASAWQPCIACAKEVAKWWVVLWWAVWWQQPHKTGTVVGVVGAQGVVGTGWLANCEVQNNGGLDGTTQASSPPVDNQQHNWVTSTGLLNGQAMHGVQHHLTLWPAVCELGVTVVLVWPPGAPHMVHVKQLHHHHHVCVTPH